MRAIWTAQAIAAAVLSCLPVPSAVGEQLPSFLANSALVEAPPACASDGSKLGLSRIVEIDSAHGGEFGGSHGGRVDFLKDKEVVLTFDDGPLRPYTSAVLKALASHCTKATFFMVGRMAVADADMVKRVAKEGHTVAGHTWSHRNLGRGNVQRAIDDLEMGNTAVTRALGKPIAPFFRYPYLSGSRAVDAHLKERGISTWWIDVDSEDYRTRDVATVHRRIMQRLKKAGKGIILMHDIQQSTAHGLPALLDDLHKSGFKVVHVVPRDDGTTVAGYDAAVDKAFEKKSKAAKSAPLARRAVTWSANGAGDQKRDDANADAASDDLPWRSTIGPGAAPAPPPSGTVQKRESTPATKPDNGVTWKPQIFGY